MLNQCDICVNILNYICILQLFNNVLTWQFKPNLELVIVKNKIKSWLRLACIRDVKQAAYNQSGTNL
jgi:hypothetical protein